MRKIILRRLKKIGWRRIDLARAMESRMSIQHVYQYLAGTNDMVGEHIAEVLRVLGLAVVADPDCVSDCTPPKKTRRKPR